MNEQIIITKAEDGFLWSVCSVDGLIDTGFEKDRFQAFKKACAACDREG